jgi:hypothetical protein
MNDTFQLDGPQATFPYIQNQQEIAPMINGYNWRVPVFHTNPNPYPQQQGASGSQTLNTFAAVNPLMANYQQL